MKLKLHLAQFKNIVEMRVLEQEDVNNSFLAKSKHVSIAYYPSLHNDSIYLRGEDSIRNNDICCITFCTEKEASQYLEKVIGWLDEVFYQSNNNEVFYLSNNKEVLYLSNNKELKKGHKVSDGKNNRYFIADLGADVSLGRYTVARCFEDGRYFGIEHWNGLYRHNKSGYNKETNEYYGEKV